MHVIGTAGHVDHGKSTLVQRLTGIDPDRFAEEKRRGLTIDLGFAWLRLPSGNEIGLIDVPGHERFISNMLTGAGGFSICLFVVAANEGWKPQSAEHLSIIHTLGISHGVVAITKVDAVDGEMLELVTEDVRSRLNGSSLEAAPLVACSALTGDGIDELIARLDEVVSAAPAPIDTGAPRLWVDRVFTIAGAGTVVTGTLGLGSLKVGDDVDLAPRARQARVRAIQSHKKEVSEIGPGNRTALNLAGLERTGAARGDAVVRPGRWLVTRRFDASVTLAPASMTGHEYDLSEKGSHLLYVGTAETASRLRLVEGKELTAGETGFVQIVMQNPLPLARGDRFVLRDAGRMVTFGGGRVLDPLPGAARRRDTKRAALLKQLTGSDKDALIALLESEGSIDRRSALFRAGLGEIPAGVARLGSDLLSPTRLNELEDVARTALRAHHASQPLERGMAREALRALTGLTPEAFEDLVELMPDTIGEGSTIREATHDVRLTPQQIDARDAIVRAIEADGYAPPLAKDLPGDAQLMRALVDSGELVKVGDFYLTREQSGRARSLVRHHIEANGPVTVAQIRDLLSTTRKYAVPLCEWLDETGATRRQGDLRTLGPHA